MNQNPTFNPHLDRWHKIVLYRDLQDFQNMLAEDVVFHSPYVWKPYQGRQVTCLILSAVSEIFQDFTYQRELIADKDWALEFSARVGDLSIKGIDLIRVNDAGQIVEFEVFIRPASGLQALGLEMAKRLR